MAQFTLYSHGVGPNGWTVAFLLKALGLSYETKYLDFGKNEQKGEEFLKITPNGRIPALVDHQNNDFTIWESKAILQYLVEKYDKERKFTVGTSPEEQAILLQWLFFQASGQGPYFGQAAHFKMFAPEKIPYGIERYAKETARVLGVLELVLSKQEYLVGGKLTIADISFISWNNFAFHALLPEGVDGKKEFPSTWAWHEKLTQLPYVAEALKEREEVVKHSFNTLQMAQFTLYSHAAGPNGWTVAVLFEALDLSYKTEYLQFDTAEHRGEGFLKLNPDGRIPALVDHHNSDYTTGKSKAILLYLVEKYNKERKFTVGTLVVEQSILLQWLFFQASEMGAYFGQAAHFVLYAPAESKSCGVERYTKEVARVFGVLERVLKEKDWLVAGKVTIADIAFFSWTSFAF
ncbi:hypothetical protein JCM8097_006133 [Rhodosporidiobolus ruineniae]